jgi:hypothetical protein
MAPSMMNAVAAMVKKVLRMSAMLMGTHSPAIVSK